MGSLLEGEGLVHGRSPSQGLARALQRVCEGEQKACCAPEKPKVDVDELEEVLEFAPFLRGWKLDNGLHMAREQPNA